MSHASSVVDPDPEFWPIWIRIQPIEKNVKNSSSDKNLSIFFYYKIIMAPKEVLISTGESLNDDFLSSILHLICTIFTCVDPDPQHCVQHTAAPSK